MTVDSERKNQEKEAIKELRKRMKGDMELEMYEDIDIFQRFLRARDLNVDNAESMLRKHLEWREKFDIKNMLNFKMTEVMEKYVPNVIIGYDKEGCVVRYCPVGNTDFKGLNSSVKPDDLIKLMCYQIELESSELKKQSEKLGRTVSQCVYIYDLQNLTFAQATDKRSLYNMFILLNIFQNNYPERLKAAYLFNVSIYFNFLYASAKTILAKSIINKINIYSDDSFKEDLLKIVDKDVLPVFLGGTRTDPDGNPLCKTFINPGGPVPEKFYIHRSKKSLVKSPGVKKLTLPRASFHEVNLEVKIPGSYLEWEFETKCRDIGFGLFHQEVVDGEEKPKELIPIQRIDTNDFAETGMYKCEEAGTYVLLFDNTYSWIRAKELFCRTKVVTPKEYESQITY